MSIDECQQVDTMPYQQTTMNIVGRMRKPYDVFIARVHSILDLPPAEAFSFFFHTALTELASTCDNVVIRDDVNMCNILNNNNNNNNNNIRFIVLCCFLFVII
jgi:hypothetical protein